MSWTDDRVEILKTKWAEGASASQIAKELGDVTRNAVIGKIHRLGLSNRADSAAAKAGSTSAPAGKARAAKPKAKAKAKPAADSPPANAKPAAKPKEAAPAKAAAPKPAAPEPKKQPAKPAPAAEQAAAAPAESAPVVPASRRIIPAGQPRPPQPSANEISPEALATVREVEKKARRLSLMELTERTCKWPIGDPATEEFWFCGLPSTPGKPYCEAHVGVAFQPMNSRRDRRR